MNKPLIYISSPYTKGDVGTNVRFQCRIWHQLLKEERVLPYAPLWSHFQHLYHPLSHAAWLEYDLAILPRFDALLRLNADHAETGYLQCESTGADLEVKAFLGLGKPVFYSVADLYRWAKDWTN